jgi:hypothetical protein
MLLLVIGISTCSPNTCYQIKYKKIKIPSGVVSNKSGLIYKTLKKMNSFLYGVFVSYHGGLCGPPSFLAC